MALNKIIVIIILIFISFKIIKEFSLPTAKRTNIFIIIFIFISLFLTYFINIFMLGLIGLVPLLNNLITNCKKN